MLKKSIAAIVSAAFLITGPGHLTLTAAAQTIGRGPGRVSVTPAMGTGLNTPVPGSFSFFDMPALPLGPLSSPALSAAPRIAAAAPVASVAAAAKAVPATAKGSPLTVIQSQDPAVGVPEKGAALKALFDLAPVIGSESSAVLGQSASGPIAPRLEQAVTRIAAYYEKEGLKRNPLSNEELQDLTSQLNYISDLPDNQIPVELLGYLEGVSIAIEQFLKVRGNANESSVQAARAAAGKLRAKVVAIPNPAVLAPVGALPPHVVKERVQTLKSYVDQARQDKGAAGGKLSGQVVNALKVVGVTVNVLFGVYAGLHTGWIAGLLGAVIGAGAVLPFSSIGGIIGAVFAEKVMKTSGAKTVGIGILGAVLGFGVGLGVLGVAAYVGFAVASPAAAIGLGAAALALSLLSLARDAIFKIGKKSPPTAGNDGKGSVGGRIVSYPAFAYLAGFFGLAVSLTNPITALAIVATLGVLTLADKLTADGNLDKSHKFFAFSIGSAIAALITFGTSGLGMPFFLMVGTTVLANVLSRVHRATHNEKTSSDSDRGAAGNVIKFGTGVFGAGVGLLAASSLLGPIGGVLLALVATVPVGFFAGHLAGALLASVVGATPEDKLAAIYWGLQIGRVLGVGAAVYAAFALGGAATLTALILLPILGALSAPQLPLFWKNIVEMFDGKGSVGGAVNPGGLLVKGLVVYALGAGFIAAVLGFIPGFTAVGVLDLALRFLGVVAVWTGMAGIENGRGASTLRATLMVGAGVATILAAAGVFGALGGLTAVALGLSGFFFTWRGIVRFASGGRNDKGSAGGAVGSSATSGRGKLGGFIPALGLLTTTGIDPLAGMGVPLYFAALALMLAVPMSRAITPSRLNGAAVAAVVGAVAFFAAAYAAPALMFAWSTAAGFVGLLSGALGIMTISQADGSDKQPMPPAGAAFLGAFIGGLFGLSLGLPGAVILAVVGAFTAGMLRSVNVDAKAYQGHGLGAALAMIFRDGGNLFTSMLAGLVIGATAPVWMLASIVSYGSKLRLSSNGKGTSRVQLPTDKKPTASAGNDGKGSVGGKISPSAKNWLYLKMGAALAGFLAALALVPADLIPQALSQIGGALFLSWIWGKSDKKLDAIAFSVAIAAMIAVPLLAPAAMVVTALGAVGSAYALFLLFA